jgi:F-type H+-transporting ATPase subunit delta
MHSASQAAVDHATEALERVVSDPTAGTAAHLSQVSAELYSVARVLTEHIELRRHLVDPTGSASLRRSLVENLFATKLDATTVRLLTTLVDTRLSSPTDLVEAVETLGRTAALASAEKDGTLSDTEDDLFRFGRILQREPQLRTLLADTTAPADKRVSLLDRVLGDKVTTTARRLLEQVVRHPYSKALDHAAERLADAAAARRDRSIARVVAPVALSPEQEDRLGDTLSRLYGRSISVQSDVDPDILGGLVVRVGGELLDGSVARHLRGAADAFPT